MKIKHFLFTTTLFCGSFAFTACSDNDDPSTDGGEGNSTTINITPSVIGEARNTTGVSPTNDESQAAINGYVDITVIPTYQILVQKATALQTAVNTFLTQKDQSSLDAACEAWLAAREPWEQSEAFLFGPTDYEGLDPSLDSWPLDKSGLRKVLANGTWGDIEDGTQESAQTLRGFHTIEFLLFEDGAPRNVEFYSNEENRNAYEYLKRVTNLLVNDAQKLYKAWNEGLGTEEVPTAFGTEFKQHNTTRFGSIQAVISQVVDGCIDIASEVGSQKIGGPYNTYPYDKDKALYDVESWYSWHSRDDYTNNIVSIENSYLGGPSGNRNEAQSLSALVKIANPNLDTELRERIDIAKKAIQAIPQPFRNNIRNVNVPVAMQACSNLETALLKIKGALNLN